MEYFWTWSWLHCVRGTASTMRAMRPGGAPPYPKNQGVVDMIRVWDWYVTSIIYSHCIHCSLCDPPFRPFWRICLCYPQGGWRDLFGKMPCICSNHAFLYRVSLKFAKLMLSFPRETKWSTTRFRVCFSVSSWPIEKVDWCETYPAVLSYTVIHIICVYISIIYIYIYNTYIYIHNDSIYVYVWLYVWISQKWKWKTNKNKQTPSFGEYFSGVGHCLCTAGCMPSS